MKKFNSNFKRFISSLMILMMVLTLIPLNVFADEETKGIDVWIRIEGHDKSLVEFKKLNVEAYDISYVDGLENFKSEKPLLIHAIVKALEEANIDVKDPKVFSAAGGFISGIGDYRSEKGGWMYKINGEFSSSGVTEYELKENDVIDMFYVLDWTNYYSGKLEATSEIANVGEEVILKFMAKKEEYGVEHDYKPVKDGVIKIKGKNEEKEYVTDDKGQVKIVFDKPGKYKILADKQLKEGNIVRPRPLVIEVKERTKIDKSIDDAINWLLKNDEVDEWTIMDLARANKEIPKIYLDEFKKEIEDNKGKFDSITDYAKYSIVASSLGLDATDLFGYNLIEKIYNHEDIFARGYNGGIFALLALDSKNYEVPEDAKWTRDNIIKGLLQGQKKDGGFAWTENWDSDVDLTAMALQALSNYKDREDVKACIKKGLDFLSKKQQKNGGYISEFTGDSSESVAQVILALTSLDIDPFNDKRFIKDANLLEKLLSFQTKDGGFEHNIGNGPSAISTEQALRGLIGYQRFTNGKGKFYDMRDAKLVEFPVETKVSFDDIDKASNWAKEYIIKAKELKLMEGKGNNKFEPKANMTRAEFATLLVNLLKLEDSHFNDKENVFIDVKPGVWYYDSVMKAYKEGIIKGKGNNKFEPDSPITREQMAVMLDRALKLETKVEKQNIKDIDKVSDWAVDSVNLVVQLGIMEGVGGNIFSPKGKVTREMAAAIIVRIYELD